MALQDLQFSYRNFTFGAGTPCPLRTMEGLEGFEIRDGDSDLPRDDGALRGLDFVAPRTIAFEFMLAGFDSYEDRWADLRQAFRPSRDTDYDLSFKLPDMPERTIRCRPIQFVRSEDAETYGFVGRVPVVLRAVDPRIYSNALQSGLVPLYVANSGGIDFDTDLGFDFSFSAGSTVEFVAQNDGDADAFPLLRFFGSATGTITSVTLTNTTTDQTIEISADIVDDQILTADMEAAVTGANRLVISLDGASRYGDWELPREAFYLAPGSNVLRYEIEGTATSSVCGVTWRDTWLA